MFAKYEIVESETTLPIRLHYDGVSNGIVPYHMHWHENIELLYMTHGVTSITINNREIIAKRRDLVIIPSNAIHSTSSIDGLTKYHMLMIDSQYLDSLNFDYHNAWFKTPIQSPLIDELFENIIYNAYSGEKYWEANVMSDVLKLLILLFNKYKSDSIPLPNTPISPIVQKAFSYVENNYKNNFSINDMASSLGVSESYFRHIFKEATKLSPKKYINYVRCKKAQELIKEKKYSLSQIAVMCGFMDLAHFSKTFKKLMNVPPSQFDFWNF